MFEVDPSVLAKQEHYRQGRPKAAGQNITSRSSIKRHQRHRSLIQINNDIFDYPKYDEPNVAKRELS